MEKQPKISIIIPSYNYGRFLTQAIRSILRQDYPNKEILIIDGGSTDASISVIKKLAAQYPEVIKWQSKKDQGQVWAINEGIKKATGKIVAYINADDFYQPDTFRQVAKSFAFNPDRKWLTGLCLYNSRSRRILNYLIPLYTGFCLKHFYGLNLHLVLNFVSQPSTFWKRSAIKEVGFFNPVYKYAFDYDYWIRLGKLGPPVIVKIPLSQFRIHNNSKSFSNFTSQFQEEISIAKSHTQNLLLVLLHILHVHLIIIPIYFLSRLASKIKT